MFKNEDEAVTSAVMAMILEVSGNPKAGNVDRDHNFPDLKYEHFIASAVSSFPVFRMAAKKELSCGELILRAVEDSSKWHKAKNVHFGAFLLLIPLLANWDAENSAKAGELSLQYLKNTTYKDSLHVLNAFRISSARVMGSKKLDLRDDDTERFITEERVNLYKWMSMAPKDNIIAKEIINSYTISVKQSRKLIEWYKELDDLNHAIVLCYHDMLSRLIDPLIISKFGRDAALEVSKKAGEIMNLPEKQRLDKIKEFDEELIEKGINPGSVADLTISTIYLAMLDGLRF
ncbi:Triphosphoribosyl-dephospho-CoA synthetase [Archaeoglobus sulfaticallidus PM70-1]|uniref:Triphosphoribosyl-dephospho-CoA synthetase n=1 Tax=Archaeoglobus sulfaticallidus PM70-1 TaxID=387631 RepID=N0BN33_9EURY|nr:triphosphoribosyl-dephospho-CoA synthase [Archaeoglobus sulfaticallidus]AGK61710.1 Triphosphoribosyl-dephospho-CoA synthetase [Archaeoglobus sulfaticallidus PM70-1]